MENADQRTHVYGVKCPTGEPLIGGHSERDGPEIGVITAAAWNLYLECGTGFL